MKIIGVGIDIVESLRVEKSLKNKVWLKSGAYLIIDHTEAMVVIDVNSG